MKLKRSISFILIFIFILSVLVSCGGDDNNSSQEGISSDNSAESNNSSEESGDILIPNENAKYIWDDKYSYGDIKSLNDISGGYYYYNGLLSDDYDAKAENGDSRMLFKSESCTRFVNRTEGYMVTIPSENVEIDLNLGALRTKLTTSESVITISYENQNPYGNNQNGWDIYHDEWIVRYISNDAFLNSNMINRTRAVQTSTELIEGYTVITYDLFIRLSKNIEYPYYNIAIIRENNTFDTFYLIVMKTKDSGEAGYAAKLYQQFDELVKSFSVTELTGTPVNIQQQYEVIVPEYWSEETKNYYNKLTNQTTVDWGVFSRSMPSSEEGIIRETNNLTKILENLQGSDFLDYNYDIMPTYTHIGWYNERHHFPTQMANEFAGGNGFNGKPVLQFTYQFTITNNSGLETSVSPMFDILRGNYENQFRKLAQDIKAYGKPVLFRLNNEMNTDWTSYCGELTLLDPDIFIETWQYLYDIFIEESVDNCIWIFNPIAVSCPYSNWGDTLNYAPGSEYMQILGLTSYEMNNNFGPDSFKNMYQNLYNYNKLNFDNFPAIISEFACGAGGAKFYDWGIRDYKDTVLGRNAEPQAKWIKEMFDCFANNQEAGYEFCKNIKGAVWFSANDYATINEVHYIQNYLQLDYTDEKLTNSFKAFREGLARTH